MWFASGGLFMVLVGALNLLRLSYASVAPGLLAVCFGEIFLNIRNVRVAGLEPRGPEEVPRWNLRS